MRGVDAFFRIEGEFTYKTDAQEYKLIPGEDFTKLGVALDLFQKEIQSAIAYKNGILELTFNDNSKVIVNKDPDYEAWELAGPGSIKLVSLPSGELAVWL
jgi:hypothetical protein